MNEYIKYLEVKVLCDAIRCTYHMTLKATPGQLVFGRDMILPIKFDADWALIQKQKKDSINNSNNKENKKRIKHEYKIGDKVLLQKTRNLKKNVDTLFWSL